jgi:flagellar basal-body rod protein FlgF
MGDGIWAAVSGASSQQVALEVTANNLANAGDRAYRADRVVFEDSLAKAKSRQVTTQSLRYAEPAKIVTDFSRGATEPTGRPLDVAIRGDGFFVVRTESGERYTRSGNMQLARDGTLTTRDGDAVLDNNRRPIRVPQNATDVQIANDGSVRTSTGAVGQLLVVNFTNPTTLEHDGSMLFRASAQTSRPQSTTATLDVAALEGSNYSPVKGMVDIIGANRTFDACERAIDAFRDADHKAASSIGSRV